MNNRKHLMIIRCLLWTAVIALMTTVFCFSAADSNESSSQSGHIIRGVIASIDGNFHTYPTEKQEKIIDRYQLFARKSAHFLAYMTMGILSASALATYNLSGKRRIVFAVLICAAYAVSDEIHQSFVPGRGPGVLDVLLDSAGALTGASIITAIIFKVRKHSEN